MIARTWRGSTTAANAEGYRRHFAESVRPALESIAGHHGALLLERRVEDSAMEFLVVTFWESWEAVFAFAGAEPDRAVVGPEARAVLREFDAFVQHHEVGLDARR